MAELFLIVVQVSGDAGAISAAFDATRSLLGGRASVPSPQPPSSTPEERPSVVDAGLTRSIEIPPPAPQRPAYRPRSKESLAKIRATYAKKAAAKLDAAKPQHVQSDGAVHDTIERKRKAMEDSVTGILCGQCGYEPETPDRQRKCPKCNAKRWESKAGGRVELSGDEEDQNV